MNRVSVVDLSQLPAMQVLETISTEAIITARMARVVTIWREKDPPAGAVYDVGNLEFDPIKINQECSTYFELLLRDRVNQAARACTLAFAIGSDLDAIASRYPGGVPRLTDESDERYRRRIGLSPNVLTPHGTSEAYEFWALTAFPALRDVTAIKVRPRLEDNPIIVITCLLEGADPRPSTAQLLQVRAYIQSQSRQGLTDVISVQAPKVRETNYHIRLKTFPKVNQASVIEVVRGKLEELRAAQNWLGTDHTRASVIAAAVQSGVYNIEVVEPAEDLIVPPDWVVRVNNVIVESAGTGE